MALGNPIVVTDENIGYNGHRVIKVYLCPNSEADGHRNSLRGTDAAGYGGVTAPKCLFVRSDLGWHGTDARLTAEYTTLTWPQWLLENQDKGIVFRLPAMTAQARSHDLDGNRISGPETSDPAHYKWEIFEGENISLRPKQRFAVRAVISDKNTYIDSFDGKQGTVNAGAMINLSTNALAGKVLYENMRVVPILADDYLAEVTYHLVYSAVSWNQQCVVQRYVNEARKVPRYDATGTLIGTQWWAAWEMVPGETRSPRILPTADLSIINNLCG